MINVKCFHFTNLATNLKFDSVGNIIQKFMHGFLKNNANTGAFKGDPTGVHLICSDSGNP